MFDWPNHGLGAEYIRPALEAWLVARWLEWPCVAVCGPMLGRREPEGPWPPIGRAPGPAASYWSQAAPGPGAGGEVGRILPRNGLIRCIFGGVHFLSKTKWIVGNCRKC